MMQSGLMGGSAMGAMGATGPTNNNSTAVNPDPNIKVNLENDDLWKSFHKVGTEMIITKMGRYDNFSFLSFDRHIIRDSWVTSEAG